MQDQSIEYLIYDPENGTWINKTCNLYLNEIQLKEFWMLKSNIKNKQVILFNILRNSILIRTIKSMNSMNNKSAMISINWIKSTKPDPLVHPPRIHRISMISWIYRKMRTLSMNLLKLIFMTMLMKIFVILYQYYIAIRDVEEFRE